MDNLTWEQPPTIAAAAEQGRGGAAGHTVDNLTIWLPPAKTTFYFVSCSIFGGTTVKFIDLLSKNLFFVFVVLDDIFR